MWAFEKLSKIKGLTFINESRELQFNGYGEKISSPEIPYPDYDILALGVKASPEKRYKITFEKGLDLIGLKQTHVHMK